MKCFLFFWYILYRISFIPNSRSIWKSWIRKIQIENVDSNLKERCCWLVVLTVTCLNSVTDMTLLWLFFNLFFFIQGFNGLDGSTGDIGKKGVMVRKFLSSLKFIKYEWQLAWLIQKFKWNLFIKVFFFFAGFTWW